MKIGNHHFTDSLASWGGEKFGARKQRVGLPETVDQSKGNYLTLETFQLNDNLWQEQLAGSGQAVDYFYRFYLDLVEKAGGLCAK